MKNLLKNKKLVIIGSIIILVILFIVFVKIVGGNKSVYGNRCSDHDNYKISNKTIKKAKETIKKIDKVNDICYIEDVVVSHEGDPYQIDSTFKSIVYGLQENGYQMYLQVNSN